MSKSRILAVMHPEEPHLGLVLPYLEHKPAIIDLAAIPEGTAVSYLHEGMHQVLYVGEEEFPAISTVWWRQHPRSIPERLPRPRIRPEIRDYAQSALTNHAMALSAWQGPRRWMSDPWAMARADSKASQLQDAAALGFWVPDTLQTSDPEKARAFIAKQEKQGGCIVKTMSVHYPRINPDLHLAFWTTKVTPALNLEHLALAPAIFQRFVAGIDLRVIVVGERTFAAEITSKKDYPGTVADWRVTGNVNPDQLVVEPHSLPGDVAEKCVALCHRKQLLYGAIDLIRDKEGNYWFLEINSMGAWAFIELATAQPIGKAVAKLLLAV